MRRIESNLTSRSPLACSFVFAGNLHVNMSAKSWDKEVEEAIEPLIYELTGQSLSLDSTRFLVRRGLTFLLRLPSFLSPPLPSSHLSTSHPPSAAEKGSISAEHGLGVMKAPHLHYSKTDDAIQMMRDVKKLFDPKGIMSECSHLPFLSFTKEFPRVDDELKKG